MRESALGGESLHCPAQTAAVFLADSAVPRGSVIDKNAKNNSAGSGRVRRKVG